MTDLIVFCKADGSSGPFHQQLCTVGSDGSGFAQLTSDTNDYNWARWSPDGKRILAGDFSDRLWVCNADGSGLRRITNISGSSTNLGYYQGDWSPDGTQCVAIANMTGSGGSAMADLQIINIDNSGFTAVTLTKKFALYANAIVSWSPDGTKFLYTTMLGVFGSPGYGILSATACLIDGSSPVDILSGGTTQQYLPWRWYPDSANILANHTAYSGPVIHQLVKSDGATTVVLYDPFLLAAAANLGAMSRDGTIAWGNTNADAILVGSPPAAGAVVYTSPQGFASLSSDGLDIKDPAPPFALTPGTVAVGAPVSGIVRRTG